MDRIQVTNVGQGYEQCKDLNDFVTEKGEPILKDLARTVKNLQLRWKGNDATQHINNLIVVKDALEALLKDAKGISSAAGAAISAVQEVIKANGGGGVVGELLAQAIQSVDSISKNDDTSEFFVDPAVESDYQDLCSENKAFISFVSEFGNKKDELFKNWEAGAGRENAVKCFNEFMNNSEDYKKYLAEAEENLGIAVGNISQLG